MPPPDPGRARPPASVGTVRARRCTPCARGRRSENGRSRAPETVLRRRVLTRTTHGPAQRARPRGGSAHAWPRTDPTGEDPGARGGPNRSARGARHQLRTCRMIRRRSSTVRLPSGNSRSLSNSQCPYSAWSVSSWRAALREVPRGMRKDWYSYSGCRTGFGGVKTLLLRDTCGQAYGLPPTTGPGIFGRPPGRSATRAPDSASVQLPLWTGYPDRGSRKRWADGPAVPDACALRGRARVQNHADRTSGGKLR